MIRGRRLGVEGVVNAGFLDVLGHQLHQAHGAGVGDGFRVAAGLRVDHGADQRGVQAILGSVLLNDVNPSMEGIVNILKNDESGVQLKPQNWWQKAKELNPDISFKKFELSIEISLWVYCHLLLQMIES